MLIATLFLAAASLIVSGFNTRAGVALLACSAGTLALAIH